MLTCEGRSFASRHDAEVTRWAWLARAAPGQDWRVQRCEVAPPSSPHFHLVERRRGRHCETKVSYLTYASALTAKRETERRHSTTLAVYLCRVCQRFHVGHATQSTEPRQVGSRAAVRGLKATKDGAPAEPVRD